MASRATGTSTETPTGQGNRAFRRRRRLALASIGAAAMLAGMFVPGSAAVAVESPIVEYGPVPSQLPNGGVCEVESDGNGKLWIEQYLSSEITSYDKATGEYESFPTPQPLSVPGGMDKDHDGHFWMTGVTNNSVIRIDTRDGSYRQWPIPWANALSTTLNELPLNTGLSLSNDVAWGADNALWFTAGGVNSIGRFDPATEEFDRFPVPEFLGANKALFGIMKPGPGRSIIFNMPQMNQVGMIDIDTKEIRTFTMPTPLSWPTGIRTAEDGTIWVGEGLGMALAHIDPVTGTITEHKLLGVNGILTSILDGLEIGSIGNPLPMLGPVMEGRDGNIYAAVAFASPATLGNQILKFNPRTEEAVMWPTPSPVSYPCDLNPDENGTIWFGELNSQKFARIDVPASG